MVQASVVLGLLLCLIGLALAQGTQIRPTQVSISIPDAPYSVGQQITITYSVSWPTSGLNVPTATGAGATVTVSTTPASTLAAGCTAAGNFAGKANGGTNTCLIRFLATGSHDILVSFAADATAPGLSASSNKATMFVAVTDVVLAFASLPTSGTLVTAAMNPTISLAAVGPGTFLIPNGAAGAPGNINFVINGAGAGATACAGGVTALAAAAGPTACALSIPVGGALVTLTANYVPGNPGYAAKSITSAPFFIRGVTAPTFTTARTPATNVPYGTAITITVTGTNAILPTGTVTFAVGATTLCSNVRFVGAVATCVAGNIIAAGATPISFVYSGDGTYSNTAPANLALTVDPAPTTTTLTGPLTAIGGQAVALVATVTATSGGGAPTGTVVFTTVTCIGGTNTIAVVASTVANTATATCSVSSAALLPTTAAIAATYIPTGGGNFAASAVNPTLASLTITAASTTLTLVSDKTSSVSLQTVRFTSVLTAVSPSLGSGMTGTITFQNGGANVVCAALVNPVTLGSGTGGYCLNNVCVTTCDVATLLPPSGAVNNVITAQYTPGATSYTAPAVAAQLTQTVTPGVPTISVSASVTSCAVDACNPTFTATVQTGLLPNTGTISYLVDGVVPVPATAGVTCSAQPYATAPYTCQPVTGSYPVGRLAVTATFTPSATAPVNWLAVTSAPVFFDVYARITTGAVALVPAVVRPGEYVAITATFSIGTAIPAGSAFNRNTVVDFFDNSLLIPASRYYPSCANVPLVSVTATSFTATCHTASLFNIGGATAHTIKATLKDSTYVLGPPTAGDPTGTFAAQAPLAGTPATIQLTTAPVGRLDPTFTCATTSCVTGQPVVFTAIFAVNYVVGSQGPTATNPTTGNCAAGGCGCSSSSLTCAATINPSDPINIALSTAVTTSIPTCTRIDWSAGSATATTTTWTATCVSSVLVAPSTSWLLKAYSVTRTGAVAVSTADLNFVVATTATAFDANIAAAPTVTIVTPSQQPSFTNTPVRFTVSVSVQPPGAAVRPEVAFPPYFVGAVLEGGAFVFQNSWVQPFIAPFNVAFTQADIAGNPNSVAPGYPVWPTVCTTAATVSRTIVDNTVNSAPAITITNPNVFSWGGCLVGGISSQYGTGDVSFPGTDSHHYYFVVPVATWTPVAANPTNAACNPCGQTAFLTSSSKQFIHRVDQTPVLLTVTAVPISSPLLASSAILQASLSETPGGRFGYVTPQIDGTGNLQGVLPTGVVNFCTTTPCTATNAVCVSSFFQGTSVRCSASLPVGPSPIFASYVPEALLPTANFAPSNSASSSDVNVVRQYSSIAISSVCSLAAAGGVCFPCTTSPCTAVVTQAVTFTATVTITAPTPAFSAPTGTVTFSFTRVDPVTGAASASTNIAACVATAISASSTGTFVATCASPGFAESAHIRVVATLVGDIGFITAGSVSAEFPFVVTKALTTTTLTLAAGPVLTGQSTAMSATVVAVAPATGTPGGTVSFYSDFPVAGTPIQDCQNYAIGASCPSTEMRGNGAAQNIYAVYNGDTTFRTSTSPTVAITVNALVTTTQLTLPAVTPVVGQLGWTIVAQLTAAGAGRIIPRYLPAGTVAFTVGAAPGTTIPSCGTVTASVDTGLAVCTITADGDRNLFPASAAGIVVTATWTTVAAPNNYYGSSAVSGTVNVIVNKASTVVSLVTTPASPVTAATGVTSVVATVSVVGPGATTAALTLAAGAPTVSFSNGATALACSPVTLTGATATCTVTINTAQISVLTATYAGNLNYAASPAGSYNLRIFTAAATAAVTFSATSLTTAQTPLTVDYGESTTLVATFSAAVPGGGTVQFSEAGLVIQGCAAAPLAAGGTTATCVLGFALPLGAHTISCALTSTTFDVGQIAASTNGVLTVVSAKMAVDITSSAAPSQVGQAVTFTGTLAIAYPGSTLSGYPPLGSGTITFSADGTAIPTCTTVALSYTSATAATATCTTVFATDAVRSITASYVVISGTLYSPGPARPLEQVTTPAVPTLAITQDLATPFYGQPLVLTAALVVPVPAVAIFDYTNSVPTQVGAGRNFLTGSTITFLADGVAIPGCAPAIPVINTVSANPPTYTYTLACVVTTANSLNPGTRVVTASFSGSNTAQTGVYYDYLPVIATSNVVIALATTVTALSGTPTGALVGAAIGSSSLTSGSITFTATVSLLPSSISPNFAGGGVGSQTAITGTVQFFNAGVLIGNCNTQALAAAAPYTATCATSFATAGAISVTAVYSGDGFFKTSTGTVAHSTGAFVTLTSLSCKLSSQSNVLCSAATRNHGQPVTLYATVTALAGSGAIAGTVAFVDLSVSPPATFVCGTGSNSAVSDATPVATCVTSLDRRPAGFLGTCTAGNVCTHSYVAAYTGTASSTSAVLALDVQPVTTAITFSNSHTTVVFDQLTQITAIVSPSVGSTTPLGTVAFSINGAAQSGCSAVTVCGATTAGCVPGRAICSFLSTGDAGGTISSAASYTPVASGAADWAAAASTANPNNIAITLAPTSLALVSSPNGPALTGQRITLTATVSVPLPATGYPFPTGTISFQYASGGVVGDCSAVALVTVTTAHGVASQFPNTATCVILLTTPGTLTIRAVFSGTANRYAISTSNTVTQVVTKASSNLAISSSPNPILANTGVPLVVTTTLTVNSGAGAPTGKVNFFVNGASFNVAGTVKCSGTDGQAITGVAPFLSVCTVAFGATFPFVAGTYNFNAQWAGDENYLGSTSPSIAVVVIPTITQTVLSAPQQLTNTVTSATYPSTSAVTGQSITYTATVSYNSGVNGVPAGTVNFLDGSNTLPNCGAQLLQSTNGGSPYFAQCTAAFPTAVNRRLTAIFTSTVSSQSGSTSQVLLQNLRPADVNVAVSGGLSPAPQVGSPVTFIAAVSAAAPGAVTANGLITGTITFTAGSAATGLILCDSVLGVMQSTNPPTLTATCTASNVPVLALLNNLVIATYSGDANFNAGIGNLQQTVTKAPTQLTLLSSVAAPVTGQSIVLTATVTATGTSVRPTGAVSFIDTNVAIVNCGAVSVVNVSATQFTATCTLLPAQQTPPRTGNALVVVGYPAGVHSITAIFTPDSVSDPFLTGSTASLPLTVTAASTSVSISGDRPIRSTSGTTTYTATLTVLTPGSALPRSVLAAAPAAADTPTGTISFSVGGTSIASCNLLPVVIQGTGWGPFVSSATGCAVSLPALSAGTAVMAAYVSNTANYLGSSFTLTQIVVPGTLGITLAATTPVVTCETITVTLTLAQTGATATPTGVIPVMAVHNIAAVAALGSIKICDVTLPATTCTGILTLPSEGGTYQVTAAYPGDTNYAVATSNTIALTVNQGSAVVRLTTTAGLPVYRLADLRYGETVTYVASVIPALPSLSQPGCIPRGTINFQYKATTVATCTAVSATLGLAFSQASCTLQAWERTNGFVSAVPARILTVPLPDTQDVQVIFSPSATAGTYVQQYAGPTVTSPAGIKQTIRKALTTLVLSTPSPFAPAPGGAATGTFTVTLAATLPGVSPTISGTTGAFTVYYYQGVAAPTALAATCVGFGLGTETANTALVQTCSAAMPAASVVPYNMFARWAPGDNDNYLQFSESPAISVTVVSGTTSTVLLSFPLNPSVVGQTVTYTATVTITSGLGVLTGKVAFTDGGTLIVGCEAVTVTIGASTTQGVASCTPGLYNAIAYRNSIIARYLGDVIFAPSVSNVLTMVTTFAQTNSLVTVSPATPIVGAPVFFGIATTVAAPGSGVPAGIYRILQGSQIICDNLVMGAGNCTQTYTSVQTVPITAVYLGAVNFATSTSPITNVVITPAPTNVTITSSVNPSITSQIVTFIATVRVLPPSSTGAVGIAGVIPTGTVSFSVSDPLCQSRGLALNVLISPTTYQATCTTSFSSTGAQPITATYSATGSTATTAGSTGSIVQTVVAGQIVTSGPPTSTPAGNATSALPTASGNTTRPANATSASPAFTSQIYLVIINFPYCIASVQWAQYRQNLANALRVAVTVIQVVTDPTFTCVAAKRQTSQRSTAVVGFSDLATAQAAVSAINGGQVAGIPGFPDPTAVLASNTGGSGGLSGGQIAGIVVGSVLGFFLIVALILIAFILGKKQGGGSEMSGRA